MGNTTSNLPCDIEQVVDLLAIEVVRATSTQLHCRCPFCADRKAHMNVKLSDNVFRCNRCGKGGGVLHLYAEYCDVSLNTAYEELCKIFRDGDSKALPRRRHQQIDTADMPIASADVRDNTYSNLMSLLSLCPSHRDSLMDRGLTQEQIEWLGYRTTPVMGTSKIVAELIERGCTLEGVPGFYCDRESGKWVLDIRGSGIMLPDRNVDGQIEAIQVRVDKVYHHKFYNLTSAEKYYGTQSRCCAHFVGVREKADDDTICLTEGVMKADIAFFLSHAMNYPHGFVGLTGVSNKSQLAAALTTLYDMGKRRVLVMYDSDYRTNDAVRQLRDYAIEAGAEHGFEMIPISWDPKYKGIDDLLLSKTSR